MADTKERDVVKYLLRHVKEEFGGTYRRVKWQGRVGAPDLLILIPKYGSVWIETKKPVGGKCTVAQVREQELLSAHGERVRVISTFDEVDTFIQHVKQGIDGGSL